MKIRIISISERYLTEGDITSMISVMINIQVNSVEKSGSRKHTFKSDDPNCPPRPARSIGYQEQMCSACLAIEMISVRPCFGIAYKDLIIQVIQRLETVNGWMCLREDREIEAGHWKCFRWIICQKLS